MPNSWRFVVNCMEIWLAANEDMIRVSELVHIYRLKESKEYGYYKLVSWVRKARIVRGLPSSFRYWKSCSFSCLGMTLRPLPARLGVTFEGYFVGGEPLT